MRKRSAWLRPLISDPADGCEPSVTTPSSDSTKFE